MLRRQERRVSGADVGDPGKDQSLEMLAARGGFRLIELLVLLADVEFEGSSGWQSDFFNKFEEEKQKQAIPSVAEKKGDET